jgi:uncharacterized membrane protein (DUF485 family)
MQQDIVDKVRRNPKYHELVSKRTRFGRILAILMLIIYYGFILLIAYAPKFLGTPISAGSVTTIGIPIGIGVILSAFVLTGIYVARANSEFDRLTNEIKREVL